MVTYTLIAANSDASLWTVGLIVGGIASLSQVLMAHINNRSRRADAAIAIEAKRVEKKEDWKRQDDVAARAEEAATKVAGAAQLLVESNKRVADVAEKNAELTIGKLDVIHTLVNSNMTAAMKAELDATIREHALMKQILTRDETDGKTIHPAARAAIISTQNRISELSSTLDDRLKQTEIANEQVASSEGRGIAAVSAEQARLFREKDRTNGG